MYIVQLHVPNVVIGTENVVTHALQTACVAQLAGARNVHCREKQERSIPVEVVSLCSASSFRAPVLTDLHKINRKISPEPNGTPPRLQFLLEQGAG